jgi:hypothetical protein
MTDNVCSLRQKEVWLLEAVQREWTLDFFFDNNDGILVIHNDMLQKCAKPPLKLTNGAKQ